MQKTSELPQTLEAINEEMEQLRSEMAQQHTQMQARAKALFAPVPDAGKAVRWMGHFERAMAVYDGVMFGIRVMRRMRTTLSRVRRK